MAHPGFGQQLIHYEQIPLINRTSVDRQGRREDRKRRVESIH
ncbi:Uncharacterised protein [Shigella flexneri]|nr:Uncharacterised protein [Shigella flexneri]